MNEEVLKHVSECVDFLRERCSDFAFQHLLNILSSQPITVDPSDELSLQSVYTVLREIIREWANRYEIELDDDELNNVIRCLVSAYSVKSSKRGIFRLSTSEDIVKNLVRYLAETYSCYGDTSEETLNCVEELLEEGVINHNNLALTLLSFIRVVNPVTVEIDGDPNSVRITPRREVVIDYDACRIILHGNTIRLVLK